MSLTWQTLNHGPKRFMTLIPDLRSCIFLCRRELDLAGVDVLKLFFSVIYEFRHKLECLSIASLYSLVYCLWARPGAYPIVKHLNGSSIG